jgi:hypothetical protein
VPGRNEAGVPRALTLLFWFCLLTLVWVVLLGTSQSLEVIAGLCAAAVGVVFVEVLRARGLLGFRAEPRLLAKAWKLPWLVPFDFALAAWVLVASLARGRRVRGTWVTVPFETEEGPRGRWQRAFGVATSNGAANALVVDLADDEARMHALRPEVFSARTVL